jgi:hypothetical protein
MVLPHYGSRPSGIMRRFSAPSRTASPAPAPGAHNCGDAVGGEKITKLEYAAKILDVSQLTRLPSFVPPQATRLATRGPQGDRLGAGQCLRTASHKVEVLEGFDDSVEAFFEEIVAAMPCTSKKDTAFLSWRYGPEPTCGRSGSSA